MRDHINTAIQATELYTSDDVDDPFEEEKTRVKTNLLNAQTKLHKYRELLDSPVYIVAIILIPWTKWDYFEGNWSQDDVTKAKARAIQYWEEGYRDQVQVQLPGSLSSSIPKAVEEETDVLKAYFKRNQGKKPAIVDEYIHYCSTPTIEEGASALTWWFDHKEQYPRLTQMARDIFSIPGMSAEVERLFSSTKLGITDQRNRLEADGIEAAECVRSWVLNKVVDATNFEPK